MTTDIIFQKIPTIALTMFTGHISKAKKSFEGQGNNQNRKKVQITRRQKSQIICKFFFWEIFEIWKVLRLFK